MGRVLVRLTVAALVAFSLALGSAAAAETDPNPIESLSVLSAAVLDLDGGGFPNDIRLQLLVATGVGAEDSFHVTVLLTMPSGTIVDVAVEVALSGPGVSHFTIVLLNQALEAGWYLLQALGEYDGYQVLSAPFPFDPTGGSIGPSGE